MKTPGEKMVEVLSYLINERHMRQYEIEDKCGISRGSISKWMAGNVKDMKAVTVGRFLVEFPFINADYIMRDHDEILNVGQEGQKLLPAVHMVCDDTVLGSEVDELRSEVSEKDKEIARLIDELAVTKNLLRAFQEYTKI